jgi:ubiquinone/menaquinone biosynthesis C-methylase UbiE
MASEPYTNVGLFSLCLHISRTVRSGVDLGMDKQEYARASYEAWQRMAEGWDNQRRWLWDSTRRIGEWLVTALDPQPGQTILELAAGTGETGFAAAERIAPAGHLISTDFAPKMVEVARQESERLRRKNVEHRVLDAQRMDLEDGSVDGVLCRFGFMLMPEPALALAETRRVLRRGGKLAFSVWGDAALNPWAAVPARVIMEHTGAPSPEPDAPGIFAMADPRRTRALVTEAGFKVERMEDVEMVWRFRDFEAVWRFLTTMAGALAVAIAAMPENEQEAVRQKLEDAAEPFKNRNGYAFPGNAQNTLATT